MLKSRLKIKISTKKKNRRSRTDNFKFDNRSIHNSKVFKTNTINVRKMETAHTQFL